MATDAFNPLPDFFLLLAEAQHAARAVDNFDLRSDVPDSEAEFNRLRADQATACMALVDYCSSRKAELERAFSAK